MSKYDTGLKLETDADLPCRKHSGHVILSIRTIIQDFTQTGNCIRI